MEDLSKFKNFNTALAKHFLAEQKMIHHSQLTLLAHNKMIKSAQLLHYTISLVKEIPDSLKNRLQAAIDKADVRMILSLSKQIQDTITILRSRHTS